MLIEYTRISTFVVISTLLYLRTSEHDTGITCLRAIVKLSSILVGGLAAFLLHWHSRHMILTDWEKSDKQLKAF